MLPAHVGSSRSALAALQREFARLRTLEHPHIARLLELGCNGQQYYVTAEKLDGEPLREVLNHLAPERLDASEVDDVLRAIGSALVYAHDNDIAHGDIRAENVLVTMDRRFVLTNFLARRTAKVAGRAPRPSDDVKGLARLAAELYTGSMSPQALRAAAHGGIPAARLNAIRAVLEPAGRKIDSVAEFLALAGLAFAGAGATARRAEPPRRSWSIWRLVLPMAAVVAVGSLFASYNGGVGASAQELKTRGLDALRAVAARTRVPPDTPTAPNAAAAGDPSADAGVAASDATIEASNAEPSVGSEESAAAAATTDTATDAPIDPAAELAAPPPQELPARQPATATPQLPHAPARAAAPPKPDPAVVTLGVAKIAAREDHAVVAIDIVRSGDTTHESSVGWWTTPDTAQPDDDYANLGRQTVTFAAGANVERVLIPIVNDGAREPNEAFMVHLGRPHGGVAGAVTATRVTVYDDD